MNSQKEKDRALRSYSQGALESPFIEGEFFVGKSADEWKVRLAALEAESPFKHAFEESILSANELDPKEFQDETETYYPEDEYEAENPDQELDAYPSEHFLPDASFGYAGEASLDEAYAHEDEDEDEYISQFEQELEYDVPSGISAPVIPDPYLAIRSFTAQQRSAIETPVLNSKSSKVSLNWNQQYHPKKSGVDPADLRHALQNYIDFSKVEQAIRGYNKQNPATPIMPGKHPIDAVLIEAIHQFQKKCYAEKSMWDGKAGPSVLDSLGLWQRKGMKSRAQTNSWARTRIKSKQEAIKKALDITPSDLKKGIRPDEWWESFVNPTFLGWTFKYPIHVYFARKLRTVENLLLSQSRFDGKTPVDLARIFNVKERHAGGRTNQGSKSIHTLGLGIDIKYIGNPHIGDYRDKPLGSQRFSDVMRRAALQVSNLRLSEKKFPQYLNKLGSDPGKSTGQIYDELAQRDRDLRTYLSGSSKQAKDDEKALRIGVFKGSVERDPRLGFLNLDRDLVIALRDRACLAWGAVDFGAGASGDIMHFDCRLDPIGQAAFAGVGGYFNKVHPCVRSAKIPSVTQKPEAVKSNASTGIFGGQVWTFSAKTLPLQVAVFSPKAALSSADVDVLVYAHGLLYPCPPAPQKPADLITKAPFALGRIVDASNRKIILVVPFMAWKKGAHPLGNPEKLNGLVDEVLEEVGRVRGTSAPLLRKLILSGHSRAYGFLDPLAKAHADPEMSRGALSRLSQVWAFDTAYTSPIYDYRAWLNSNPNLIFHVFYRKKSKTEPHGRKFLSLAPGSGGRFNVKDIPESHCSVPIKRLPDLLVSALDSQEISEFLSEAFQDETELTEPYISDREEEANDDFLQEALSGYMDEAIDDETLRPYSSKAFDEVEEEETYSEDATTAEEELFLPEEDWIGPEEEICDFEQETFYDLETSVDSEVVFPSGESLRVITGYPDGKEEAFWDPTGSGNPLLDTGHEHKAKKLSANFTVRELTTSGGVSADAARIDPKLVECLQRLRNHVGIPVTITSGYRSWKRNKDIYAKYNKKPTLSQHCAGRAADIKIKGLNGLEIARAAVDACGPKIGLGLANTFAHIDVRGYAAAWNYERVPSIWLKEIKSYQQAKTGKVIVAGKKLFVTADSLNVRSSPSLKGNIIGSLRKGENVDWLDSSSDGQWYKVQKGSLTGWSFHKYLAHKMSAGPLDRIIQVAAESTIARYKWRDRGVAPPGYIKGMALVYARVYCKLKAGDGAAVEMAKADTGNTDRDALAHYAKAFNDAGMNNDSSGIDTLRHLFVLLIGLGMRESSGKYCAGRDRSASNTSADTAEAGLFQTSYNARRVSPLMPRLFRHYLANPSGFVDIFREGVRCKSTDLENFGTGDGKEFQSLSKTCPAFAAEFTAVGLRNVRKHWGPINRKAAEIRHECDAMLLQVQKVVDEFTLCPALQ
jgi:uncharacterized protein YcbK (DUF882 family)